VNPAELDAPGLEVRDLKGGVVDDDVDAVQQREDSIAGAEQVEDRDPPSAAVELD
jgi:hypothetical protein